jgi:drug/metabolite transporter superfamily protein YnfA
MSNSSASSKYSFQFFLVWVLIQFRNSIVISCFAIVILSVIGALFSANHHSMMGTTEDPADGKAVAGTVFSAVVVYAVCTNRTDTRGGYIRG